MRLYLAGQYGRRAELADYGETLACDDGFIVGAEWLSGPDQRLLNGEVLDAATEAEIETRTFATQRAVAYARMCALQDLADVEAADLVVMFTGGGRGGGRHVEVGYAIALRKPVLLVGDRENVFQCLPDVHHKPDWPTARQWLVNVRRIHNGQPPRFENVS